MDKSGIINPKLTPNQIEAVLRAKLAAFCARLKMTRRNKTLKIQATIRPSATPGTLKIKLWIEIIPIRWEDLKPRALNIPYS